MKNNYLKENHSTPLPRHPALEAKIKHNIKDKEAWHIYGDWLQTQGDPRGELIQLGLTYKSLSLKQQTLLKQTLFQKETYFNYLSPTVIALLSAYASAITIHWYYGFITLINWKIPPDNVELTQLEPLFLSDASIFLQKLELDIYDFEKPKPLFKTKCLPIDEICHIINITQLKSLKLVSQRQNIVTTLDSNYLETLELIAVESQQALLNSKLPHLTTLKLIQTFFNQRLLLALLQAIFIQLQYPKLKNITIGYLDSLDIHDLLTILEQSPLLEQLESIDFTLAWQDNHLERLLQLAPRLKNLKIFDLSYYNQFSEKSKRVLQQVFTQTHIITN